jgi:hypothetical protein
MLGWGPALGGRASCQGGVTGYGIVPWRNRCRTSPCAASLRQVGFGQPLRVVGRCPAEPGLLVDELFLLVQDPGGGFVAGGIPCIVQCPALQDDLGRRAGERRELRDPPGAVAECSPYRAPIVRTDQSEQSHSSTYTSVDRRAP